tara:strand:+ start:246 stop:443 length:198 start_codon:yes stop_codon:yes gene_type:complete
MGRKKKQKRKLKTLQQALDYINDKSRIIKEISRDVFMGADIGMRKHKDKKKYSRKVKHKKRYEDE